MFQDPVIPYLACSTVRLSCKDKTNVTDRIMYVGNEEMHKEFSMENLTERDHLRRVVVDERAIFQQVLEKQFLRV